MSRLVFCRKLDAELEGLSKAPYPGELGQEIYDHISKKAWDEWLKHQTMLINEYRLSLIEPKAREFLEKEMVTFLFHGGADKPSGYTPEE
ncbi:MAG: oxidative damage protection protein [Gammaproteobacteria bacterium]|nr:oxidative damage protection protein [Gammaproteobacteria bacterium]